MIWSALIARANKQTGQTIVHTTSGHIKGPTNKDDTEDGPARRRAHYQLIIHCDCFLIVLLKVFIKTFY